MAAGSSFRCLRTSMGHTGDRVPSKANGCSRNIANYTSTGESNTAPQTLVRTPGKMTQRLGRQPLTWPWQTRWVRTLENTYKRVYNFPSEAVNPEVDKLAEFLSKRFKSLKHARKSWSTQGFPGDGLGEPSSTTSDGSFQTRSFQPMTFRKLAHDWWYCPTF